MHRIDPRWLAAGLMLLFASPIAAATLETPHDGSAIPGAPATTGEGVEPSFEDAGPALDPQALERYRGGADTVTNTVDIDGGVSNNSANDIVTGDNVVDGGAFANSAGISTVIQNSGANVLIQNGTVVNVQFTDPGAP